MAIVTISRALGSGGDEIALKVAEKLGYELVDNALIVKVAERAGVSIEDATYFDERYQSRVVRWLKSFVEPRVGKILTQEGTHLDPEKYVEYCKTVILGLAETGNVIIVGRGGQFILKDRDNAFHVRIVADNTFRIEQVKKRHDISDSDALDMIKKSDNMRKNYIKRYLKENMDNPLAYHLVLESSKLGIGLCVSIIVEAVKDFSKTREYIPGVRDRQARPNRRKGEQRKIDRRFDEVGWTSKDLAHVIKREGRPPLAHTKHDLRKAERRKSARRTGNQKTVENDQ